MAPNNSKPRKSLWDSKLGAALSQLYASLDVVETNEPINRREGDASQAGLEHRSADSYWEAIKILEAKAT